MAIAKRRVDPALVTRRGASSYIQPIQARTDKEYSAAETVAESHHLAWINYLGLTHGCKRARTRDEVTAQAKRISGPTANAIDVVSVPSRDRIGTPSRRVPSG